MKSKQLYFKRKNEEIWLSPITKALIPTGMSKVKLTTQKRHKNDNMAIADRLRTVKLPFRTLFIVTCILINPHMQRWYSSFKTLGVRSKTSRFNLRSRFYDFRDWFSAALKSRYNWNIAKATKILNQQTISNWINCHVTPCMFHWLL